MHTLFCTATHTCSLGSTTLPSITHLISSPRACIVFFVFFQEPNENNYPVLFGLFWRAPTDVPRESWWQTCPYTNSCSDVTTLSDGTWAVPAPHSSERVWCQGVPHSCACLHSIADTSGPGQHGVWLCDRRTEYLAPCVGVCVCRHLCLLQTC